jgi:hypothetical protein
MATKEMILLLGTVLALGTIVSAQERKSYAELNAPFIFSAIEKTKLPVITKNVWDMKKNEMNSEIPENKGVYMLYYDMKEEKKQRRYPVYIGSTATGTFRRSLQNEYQKEGGSIRTILEGKFPVQKTNFPLDALKVKLVDMPKETEAKMFERAMLETFYFALNEQESRSARFELATRDEMVKPVESKTIFDLQLRNIMNDLQGFFDAMEK